MEKEIEELLNREVSIPLRVLAGALSQLKVCDCAKGCRRPENEGGRCMLREFVKVANERIERTVSGKEVDAAFALRSGRREKGRDCMNVDDTALLEALKRGKKMPYKDVSDEEKIEAANEIHEWLTGKREDANA